MQNSEFYKYISETSLQTGTLDAASLIRILEDSSLELLPLLEATWQVRKAYFGNRVKIHILDNVQSGNCSENCSYCAQSKDSDNPELAYPMKSEEEILAEAKYAFEAGAFRHCMVFSGKILGESRIERICEVVKKIKAAYPMEICVSAGFLSEAEAAKLKSAGVNRYNHNLNTSRSFYPQICTTHTYDDRLNTIRAARREGLDICSGVIIGMGESSGDILNIIEELKQLNPDSIPINFFIPVKGHRLESPGNLTPLLCLKILCLFRLALPARELRIAGGREYHLRSLQPYSLYIVNSLFANGYLTTEGDSVKATKQMIVDAGFKLERIEF